MGNTLVQDAATGSLMELSPGFVPIGMKEYGGILYVASVNKDGEGEIGSMPSPLITWNREDATYLQSATAVVTGGSTLTTPLVRISDKLRTGNKFLVTLNLDLNESPTFLVNLGTDEPEYQLTIDLLTQPWKTVGDKTLTKGFYNLHLYSVSDSNTQQLTAVESAP
jgi:hypothetical protein